MTKALEQWIIGLTCALFFSAACGGGGGVDAPKELEEERVSTIPDEAVAVTEVLVQSFQSAFFASLVADTTAIAGIEGRVRIEGNTWTMEQYSPDGKLFLDGTLDVGKALYPNIPVKGTITLTGVQESIMVLDIVIGVQGSTGTIAIDEVVYDVADLIAAGEAADE